MEGLLPVWKLSLLLISPLCCHCQPVLYGKHGQCVQYSSLFLQVYIVGHIPPGFFEKKRGKPWFRRDFNERYLKIVQKHHRVIAAQFFGHHHTDSFRMFYSDTGSGSGCPHVCMASLPTPRTSLAMRIFSDCQLDAAEKARRGLSYFLKCLVKYFGQ